ncbi:hypothetical protein ETB97_010050 [Aspergillus alliaceus]|uniref:Uncharacterized protein n=1 Tax=Petromyces alliaceus TaxID=209559 RepID=A0A5N7BR41_PETAA|nr:hypothetical protein BDV23DRAFT_189584 [Aspergillus alliaceus]KAF5855103.1 hypothetical protein ETB97_010050 [Aspergillus burnettii]
MATIHYAKGIAYAATGRIEEAENERQLFHTAPKHVSPTRYDYPNKCVDILTVGEAMLDGELNYWKGVYDLVFSQLREAIKRYDGLAYKQNHVEEAVGIYCDDLGLNSTLARAHQHPNNVWALKGYHECLVRLGRNPEAKLLKPQLNLALAVADIPVNVSCFCRTTAVEPVEKNGTCCSK